MAIQCVSLLAMTLVAAGMSSSATADSSLEGWWEFDECEDEDVADDSGNGNGFSGIDTGRWEEGRIGCALEFWGGGSTDYEYIDYDAGDPTSLTNVLINDTFTFEAWIYLFAEPGPYYRDIMGFPACETGTGFGYSFGLDTDRKLGLRFQNGEDWYWSRSALVVPVGTWSHVAVTFNASVDLVTFHLNGEAEYVYEDGVSGCTTADFHLGLLGWHALEGKIDGARVWSRDLDPAEVKQNYINATRLGIWRMNEGTGNVTVDDSGNDNDGDLCGPPIWVDGYSGKALEFTYDNTSDHVNVPSSPDLKAVLNNHKLTYEAWIKPDSMAGDIVGFSGAVPANTWGYSFRFSSNKLTLSFQDSGGTWHHPYASTLTVPTGKWSHVAVTFDGDDDKVVFYVNGDSETLSHVTAESGSTGSSFRIGLQGWYSMDGIIDEVKVHSRALDADEIRQSYEDGSTVGLWHLDEGTDNSASDASGHDNDGDLYGPPIWVDGYSGKALEFTYDNTSDHVNVPSSPVLKAVLNNHKLTYEAWIKPDSMAGDIVGFSGAVPANTWGYSFRFSSNKLMLSFQDSGGTWHQPYASTLTAPTGKWSHVAVTFDGDDDKVVFYVNGDSETLSDVTAESGSTGSSFRIGLQGWYSMDGIIDEVKVHSRALDADEIQQSYEDGTTVGLWHLDEGTGNSASDASGHDNDGDVYGPPTWVDGHIGKALEFTYENTSDHVNVPSSPVLKAVLNDHKLTYEAWIKPDSMAGDIVGFSGAVPANTWGYSFRFSSNKLMLSFQDSGGSWHHPYASTLTVPTGKWSHVAVTFDGGDDKVVFYVNGDSETVPNVTAESGSTGSSFRIGLQGWYSMDGIIDEVRVHSRVLSATEINDQFERQGGTSYAYGFGADANPTGEPIGGGYGYSDIIDCGNCGDQGCCGQCAEYCVDSGPELASALGSATDGDVIYVAGDATIDLSGEEYRCLEIRAGVTLASNRGSNQDVFGGEVYSDTDDDYSLFVTRGPGVRITGLRIKGPNPNTQADEWSEAVSASHTELTVDNCEISGWPHVAVLLCGGATDAVVKHNDIHNCQGDGYGYGVHINASSSGSADAIIEANQFDYVRHAIAGSGYSGSGYTARYNLVLENSTSYSFDMHCDTAPMCTPNSVAGDTILIHHNTFRLTDENIEWVILINGRPDYPSEIHHNWFYKGYTASTVQQRHQIGNLNTYMNLYLPSRMVMVVIPEPSLPLLLGSGVAGLALLGRRKTARWAQGGEEERSWDF